METSTFLFTIGAGIVVAVVALVLEYGFFRRKRKSERISDGSNPKLNPQPPSIQTSQALQPQPAERPQANQDKNLSQRWIDIIYETVRSFCKNQGETLHKVKSMNVQNDRAYVHIYAWRHSSLQAYDLVIDRSGDILEVKHR